MRSAVKKIRIILLFFAASALYAGEWKDIPYYEKTFPVRGDGEALRTFCKLDLKTPETKNFPTLVWFHGGGLSRGSRFLPREIDTKKIAVVSVDYRLSGPKVSHPDYIFDAAAAVSWTLGNIRKHGGDPKLDIPSRAEENRLLAARLTRVYKHKAVKFVSIPQTGHGTCLSPCLAMISEILSKL